MFDEAEDARLWLSDPPTVTAILVAHNGVAWLPKVLSSLGSMEYAPTAWHAVDVSSIDGSADLLNESFGAERMTYAPSGTGFGEAVRLGLAAAPTSEWIWLLHDDSAVERGTLAALLDEALRRDDVAIVGPKIREWPSLRRIVEVGLTLTGTGVRVTGLEPGEPDRGQHDRPRDVLAVNTAGMLIRRDAWEDLGGFDSSLRLYCDDLDFGWRAARAGYRVRAAPRAIIFHAEASSRGSRGSSAGDVHDAERRRAAIFTSLANVGRRAFLWQYLRLFFGSLLRVLGFLLAKAPEEAGDELLALRSVYLHPGQTHAARKARAASARVKPSDVRRLLPSPWLPYQHGFDSLRDVFTSVMRPETIETSGRRTSNRRSSAFDAVPDGTQDLPDQPSILMRRPWLVTVLLLALLSVFAARGLLGEGHLQGGALLAAPDTAGGWWRLFFERWHDVSIGSDVTAPPYALMLGAVATPVWFAPSLVITVLMLGVIPLAAMTAHRLGRTLCATRSVRIVWSVTYGLSIVATGAVAEGRIGTVVALILAPVVVNATRALVEKPGWQAGLRVGLWLALATAFAPVAYLLTLPFFVVIAIAYGRERAQSVAIATAVPVILLGEWMWQRVVTPPNWWWEAGQASAGVGELSTTAWNLALGRVGGPGGAPAWLNLGILGLAVAALFAGRSRRTVTWAWAVALVGLAAVVAGNSLTFTPVPGPESVPVWNGIGAVLWISGLSAAVMLVADDLVARPMTFRFARSWASAAIVLALVAPLGTGAWWLVRGQNDPLTRGSLSEVPAYLAAREDQKTLVVDGDIADGIRYEVVVGAGLRLGQESVVPSRSASTGVTALVASLLSHPSDTDLDALASYGIRAIYAPAEVDAELARRLDAAPGLAPSGSEDPDSRVWVLEATPVKIGHEGGYSRWAIAGAHAFLVIIAVVLTVPVRQRRRHR
ncbi:MAG TPA: glycosyltransferase family 2 protein [Aeromicrobium sp.]|nr:glycosyltransferase family 2 protein [Aeromicrobium sp.]